MSNTTIEASAVSLGPPKPAEIEETLKRYEEGGIHRFPIEALLSDPLLVWRRSEPTVEQVASSTSLADALESAGWERFHTSKKGVLYFRPDPEKIIDPAELKIFLRQETGL